MNSRNLAIVPVVVLVAAIILTVFLEFSDLFILNPPYVLLALNLIFWTITSLAIAFVSAKSYIKDGSLPILLLSSSIIIFGLSVIVSGWVSTFSGPLSVAVSNQCILVASAIQLFSSILTFRGIEPRISNRRVLLAITYFVSVFFVVASSIVVLVGPYPEFFTATGPTLLRQVILGLTVFLFAVASIIFGFQYLKTKSPPLFWYTFAIALFSIGLFSAFEVKTLGDVPTWLGRATLYLGTTYLLAAILASRQKSVEGSNLAGSWTDAFKGDPRQISTLFSNMLDAFVYGKAIIDENGKTVDTLILEVNDAFERITGIKKENAVGKKVSELVPGVQNDPAGWVAIYGRVAITEEPVQFDNFLEPLKRWYHVSAYSPKKGYFVSIFEDITERKKTEEALKENEQLYRTIFDNSQDGFQLTKVIYDENGKPVDCLFLKVNAAYERQSGIKAEEIVGKTARQFAPNSEQFWFDLFDEVAKTGKTKHVERYNEPTRRWYDFYVFPYTKDTVGSLLRDITDRKNLEQQLKDSERLATIGATAGMVGHDIRNPLQAILGDVYFAKKDLASIPESEAKHAIEESLTEIEKNTDYLNKIVQDLQDYARPLSPAAKEIDIEAVFNDILVKKAIPKGIKVFRKVEAGAERVVSDYDLLKRILANLTNNAVQAMPDGGKLSVHASREGTDLVITVEDTGLGIPEDSKSRLFTPLFTTKSKGQGFGLVVVKRITEALGGTINFESERGKGTKFILRLPSKERTVDRAANRL